MLDPRPTALRATPPADATAAIRSRSSRLSPFEAEVNLGKAGSCNLTQRVAQHPAKPEKTIRGAPRMLILTWCREWDSSRRGRVPPGPGDDRGWATGPPQIHPQPAPSGATLWVRGPRQRRPSKLGPVPDHTRPPHVHSAGSGTRTHKGLRPEVFEKSGFHGTCCVYWSFRSQASGFFRYLARPVTQRWHSWTPNRKFPEL